MKERYFFSYFGRTGEIGGEQVVVTVKGTLTEAGMGSIGDIRQLVKSGGKRRKPRKMRVTTFLSFDYILLDKSMISERSYFLPFPFFTVVIVDSMVRG